MGTTALATWVTRNRTSLRSGAGAPTLRRRVADTADRLQLDELLEAREGVLWMYKKSQMSQERRRLRSLLTTFDNHLARTRLEIDVRSLSDPEFALLLSLPHREPFDPGALRQAAGLSHSSGIVEALLTLGLLRPWADGRLHLSSRGAVLRTVAAMRVTRKTAEAERTIARSPCSYGYRTAVRRIIALGSGEPEIRNAKPSVSLPLTAYQATTSVPTIIVSLTNPAAFHWVRISKDSRWAGIKLHAGADLFRAEAIEFLRGIFIANSPTETLEVVAITLQHAESRPGQDLGRIAEKVLLEGYS